MYNLVLDGLLIGLIISFSFGPAFFAVIHNSISKGFKHGIALSLGVNFSDFLFVLLVFFVGNKIFSYPINKVYMGVFGGLILIAFGIVIWLKKIKSLKTNEIESKISANTKLAGQFLRGFLLNIANPFVFLFWFGTYGYLRKSFDGDAFGNASLMYYGASFFTVISLDIIKSYFGAKVAKFIIPRTEKIINRVLGSLLIVFGIVLIIRTFLDYQNFSNLA